MSKENAKQIETDFKAGIPMLADNKSAWMSIIIRGRNE